MRLRSRAGAGMALAVSLLALAGPAHADRWFGSIGVSCDSFAYCILSPEMPDPPGDPATLRFERSGNANAPLETIIWVNKPVAGGVPIRFELGEKVFALQPGTDILMERRMHDGVELVPGYRVAPAKAEELLAAMRATRTGRLKLAVSGKDQEREVHLDGLDEALRFLDERQGRTGATDAIISKGPRAASDVAAPKPLPGRAAWPKEIEQLFKRNDCEDRVATSDWLSDGTIATPSAGHEVWQVPCAGGNYNVHFIVVDIRNGDPKTARQLFFPTRRHARAASVLTNPVWWDARREIWAFERGHAHGDCGTVALYRWTGRGFALVNERQKEDCDWKFTDPWTTWAETKSRRKPAARR